MGWSDPRGGMCGHLLLAGIREAEEAMTLTADRAAKEGLTAIRILGDIRARTGGWFDCECGQCFDEGNDCHAWDAFLSCAVDAIHFAVLILAEQDATELAESLRELSELRADVRAQKRVMATWTDKACRADYAALKLAILGTDFIQVRDHAALVAVAEHQRLGNDETDKLNRFIEWSSDQQQAIAAKLQARAERAESRTQDVLISIQALEAENRRLAEGGLTVESPAPKAAPCWCPECGGDPTPDADTPKDK